MTEYNMEASIRKSTSKGYRHDLFQKGLIPAVVYGKNVRSLPLEVDRRDLKKALQEGKNTIINLSVQGNGGPYKVMVRDLQYDPVKRDVIHADFQQISLRRKVHATVPLQIAGEAEGGLARLVLRAIEVSCLPTKIPAQITVNVAGMKPGDVLEVSDLNVPKDISVLTDPDIVVATVLTGEAGENANAEEAPEEAEGRNGADAAAPVH